MTTPSENTENSLPSRQELRNLNRGPVSFSGPAAEDVFTEEAELLEEWTECLREFMLPERFDSLRQRLESRTRYMLMCLEDIYYPHNASAVIRSSEAFGIQEIHAVEQTVRFLPSKNVVRGTDQWIDIRKWPDTPSLVDHLRSLGYRIVVTSPRPGSATPADFDVTAGPFALFMGTEKTGISDWLMEQADDHVSIPMVGFAESLNISVSAAILAQRLTERLRREVTEQAWQLSRQDRANLLYKWVHHSVKDADGILRRKGYEPKLK